MRFKPVELAPLEYVRCPSCPAEVTSLMPSGLCWDCDDKRKTALEQQKRMKDRMERVLGPKGMAEFDFAKFRVVAGTENAYERAIGFDPNLFNLYLHGPCGTGKTHLGFAIAKKFLESGQDVAVYKPTDIMRLFRRKDAEEEDKQLARMAKHDVLVIDDLGVGKATEFANQILYEIIDLRIMNYRHGLVITSNLSLQQFAEKVGDDRLPSRIAGMCEVVEITSGKDWRIK